MIVKGGSLNHSNHWVTLKGKSQPDPPSSEGIPLSKTQKDKTKTLKEDSRHLTIWPKFSH